MTTYSVNRIASDSLAGGVSAEIYGQKFKDGLLFSALVSSMTFVTVRLRAYQLKQSRGFPGQVGEAGEFRGLPGKIGGERTFEKYWIDSGAAQALEAGKPIAWVLENKYLPYRQQFKALSPLGGHQGSIGQIFGIPYKPDGLISYVIEGFGGVHDTFNQPFYYNANGTNRLLHGSFEKVLGKIINPVNVLLASPIVLPALVPDYMRHLYFQEKY